MAGWPRSAAVAPCWDVNGTLSENLQHRVGNKGVRLQMGTRSKI